MSSSLHIVCSQCHSTNRIPKERLSDSPKCGQCKTLLFLSQPVELTDQTFNKHINNNDIFVLVDFWASWCGPCKIMGPEFAKAASQLEPHIRLAKLDTENNQSIAAQFSIRSIPTIILFKRGKKIAEQAGAMSTSQIIQWAQKNIS